MAAQDMPLSALSQAAMVIEPMGRELVVVGMKAAAIVGARDWILSTVNDMDVQHRDTARPWRRRRPPTDGPLNAKAGLAVTSSIHQ
jgi:hypothetical protein